MTFRSLSISLAKVAQHGVHVEDLDVGVADGQVLRQAGVAVGVPRTVLVLEPAADLVGLGECGARRSHQQQTGKRESTCEPHQRFLRAAP